MNRTIWIDWPRAEMPTLRQEIDCGELGKAMVIEAKLEHLTIEDGAGNLRSQVTMTPKVLIAFKIL